MCAKSISNFGLKSSTRELEVAASAQTAVRSSSGRNKLPSVVAMPLTAGFTNASAWPARPCRFLNRSAPRRPPPANATCAIVGAIAVLSVSATSQTRGPGPRATPAAPARAARPRPLLASRRAARSSASAARTRATPASRPARRRDRRTGSADAGTAARFFSASAAIIASMTRSETPPLFSATSARGDKSNCTTFAPMTAMIVESLNSALTIAPNVVIRDGGRGRRRG